VTVAVKPDHPPVERQIEVRSIVSHGEEMQNGAAEDEREIATSRAPEAASIKLSKSELRMMRQRPRAQSQPHGDLALVRLRARNQQVGEIRACRSEHHPRDAEQEPE